MATETAGSPRVSRGRSLARLPLQQLEAFPAAPLGKQQEEPGEAEMGVRVQELLV